MVDHFRKQFHSFIERLRYLPMLSKNICPHTGVFINVQGSYIQNNLQLGIATAHFKINVLSEMAKQKSTHSVTLFT